MGNMGNPQTWNPWIYAVNNPVRYKDASGYSPVEAWSDADWYSTIPGETKESSWAPDFIAYSIEEDAASGGKGFKANAAGAEYQETFLDWLDGASDNLMQTKVGDVMAYGDMMTVNFTIPGLMPSVYGWEMLVEGKTYEESTKEIQDFFRGYNKSFIKYIPETLYGMISIPESLWTVGESVSENGLLNTVKAMGSGIIDGITTTVRDDLVNGTAKSRGEIVGDCATFILEFVIGSKLLKDVTTKNVVPDADDVSDALKGVADKADDVLKGTENALKDNADDILQKTDDVLEHMDDVPEVKGKGMEDAAESLSGAVDDVVECGIDVLPNAEDLKMSQTVQNHMNDVIKKGPNAGQLSRPYIDSNGTTLLLNEIMQSADPVPDAILQSGLRWDVSGTFRGSTGTWELVVDTSTNTVVHFNFVAQ